MNTLGSADGAGDQLRRRIRLLTAVVAANAERVRREELLIEVGRRYPDDSPGQIRTRVDRLMAPVAAEPVEPVEASTLRPVIVEGFPDLAGSQRPRNEVPWDTIEVSESRLQTRRSDRTITAVVVDRKPELRSAMARFDITEAKASMSCVVRDDSASRRVPVLRDEYGPIVNVYPTYAPAERCSRPHVRATDTVTQAVEVTGKIPFFGEIKYSRSRSIAQDIS